MTVGGVRLEWFIIRSVAWLRALVARRSRRAASAVASVVDASGVDTSELALGGGWSLVVVVGEIGPPSSSIVGVEVDCCSEAKSSASIS